MKSTEKVKILEEDLYKPVHDYLVSEGYNVYSEVKHCDVTAVKDEELLIVEMKQSLNLELVLQGTKRQRATDSVYVAVPKPKGGIFSKRWNDLTHLLRRLELGLILVTVKKDHSYVEVVFHPSPFDREKSKRSAKRKKYSIIKEIDGRHGDYNTGGSCRKKLVTAYRENAIQIACLLKALGHMSPAKLRALGTDEKKTRSILSDNHYGWFEKLGRGTYGLSQKGLEELVSYTELTEFYMSKLKEKTDIANKNEE